MKHILITYGDLGYEVAKTKIYDEAKATGEFDEIISYGREDLSDELLKSDIINIKRGGGLWSWKPDVILSTMKKSQIGDVIIYCDAGCTIYPSKEWSLIWKKLATHDIIAQRIFMRTDRWTRKEIIDYFSSNGKDWLKKCQFQATIFLKVSDFTLKFIREWRDIMIKHPELAMDVSNEEKQYQHNSFVENRHDQAIYSALIYKYLSSPKYKEKICCEWEHIEDFDIFHKQAIRATRLRHGEKEKIKSKLIGVLKRIIKDLLFKSFYHTPFRRLYIR